MHVAEVIFAFDIVLVVLDELILIGKFEDDGEEAKELDDNFVVTLSAELLDFFDVIFQDWRLGTLMEAIEFGKVVDLNIVFDGFGESEWSAKVILLGDSKIKHTV